MNKETCVRLHSELDIMNDMVYMITGIIPYSGGERVTIAVYLNKDKALERVDKEEIEDYYLDVQMDEYEVDG